MKNSTRGKFIFTNLEFKEFLPFISYFMISNTQKKESRDVEENERGEEKNFPKEFCK